MFYSVWIPGFIYSFSLLYTSTNGYYSICHGSIVCFVATGLIIFEICSHEKNEMELYTKHSNDNNSDIETALRNNENEGLNRRTVTAKRASKICLYIIVAGMLISQMGALLYMRIPYYYWENPNDKQECYITEGPEKGLYVTKAKFDYYMSTLDSLKKYNNSKGGNLAVFSSEEWIYLYLKEYRNGTFCPYIGIGPYRVKEYYELNPDKKPDYIYIDYEYLNNYPMEDIILNEYSVIEQIENGAGAYIYGRK